MMPKSTCPFDAIKDALDRIDISPTMFDADNVVWTEHIINEDGQYWGVRLWIEKNGLAQIHLDTKERKLVGVLWKSTFERRMTIEFCDKVNHYWKNRFLDVGIFEGVSVIGGDEW